MNKQKRHTPEEIIRLLRENEANGLSQEKFCQQKQISVPTLHRWRKKFAQMDEAASAETINFASSKAIRQVSAQAAPLGNPSTESLFSFYGFVLSMDLDGFTKRVAQAAVGSMDDKRKLAEDFLDIMRRAAAFAESHPDSFIQFPFAGDNAIFAVTADTLADYITRKKVNPVKTALEWEESVSMSGRRKGGAAVPPPRTAGCGRRCRCGCHPAA
jgi:transcriptional regulator with XRE-family HTH domain